MAAAKGADSTRINELALKLGLVAPPRVGAPAGPGGLAGGPGGGGGGRGFGGLRGPGAALGQLAGAWNGSGARHGGLQAPSGTQRAVLARAKEALAEMEKELARKP
jgi:hypothetical protein